MATVDIVHPSQSGIHQLGTDTLRPNQTVDGGFVSERGHAEFEGMLVGSEFSDVSLNHNTSYSSTPTDVFQLFRAADSGKAEMQSALVSAAKTPTPEALFEANKALSKYDLQTLLISKAANKIFQAFDRLTNLS